MNWDVIAVLVAVVGLALLIAWLFASHDDGYHSGGEFQ